MHLIFPLISSLLYVAAAMFFKQAASRGVGPWRTAVVCNGLTGIVFLTLWPLGGSFPGMAWLWQPLVVASAVTHSILGARECTQGSLYMRGWTGELISKGPYFHSNDPC